MRPALIVLLSIWSTAADARDIRRHQPTVLPATAATLRIDSEATGVTAGYTHHGDSGLLLHALGGALIDRVGAPGPLSDEGRGDTFWAGLSLGYLTAVAAPITPPPDPAAACAALAVEPCDATLEALLDDGPEAACRAHHAGRYAAAADAAWAEVQVEAQVLLEVESLTRRSDAEAVWAKKAEGCARQALRVSRRQVAYQMEVDRLRLSGEDVFAQKKVLLRSQLELLEETEAVARCDARSAGWAALIERLDAAAPPPEVAVAACLGPVGRYAAAQTEARRRSAPADAAGRALQLFGQGVPGAFGITVDVSVELALYAARRMDNRLDGEDDTLADYDLQAGLTLFGAPTAGLTLTARGGITRQRNHTLSEQSICRTETFPDPQIRGETCAHLPVFAERADSLFGAYGRAALTWMTAPGGHADLAFDPGFELRIGAENLGVDDADYLEVRPAAFFSPGARDWRLTAGLALPTRTAAGFDFEQVVVTPTVFVGGRFAAP